MLPIYEDEHWSLYKPSNVSQAMSMRRGTNWDLYKYFNEKGGIAFINIMCNNLKCKFCGSNRINKRCKQKYNGKQRYLLKEIENNEIPKWEIDAIEKGHKFIKKK